MNVICASPRKTRRRRKVLPPKAPEAVAFEPTKDTPPTHRQMEVRNWIDAYCKATGLNPTIREVAKAFGFRSPNGVMCHLHPLRDRGLVNWIDGRSRTLRVTEATT